MTDEQIPTVSPLPLSGPVRDLDVSKELATSEVSPLEAPSEKVLLPLECVEFTSLTDLRPEKAWFSLEGLDGPGAGEAVPSKGLLVGVLVEECTLTGVQGVGSSLDALDGSAASDIVSPRSSLPSPSDSPCTPSEVPPYCASPAPDGPVLSATSPPSPAALPVDPNAPPVLPDRPDPSGPSPQETLDPPSSPYGPEGSPACPPVGPSPRVLPPLPDSPPTPSSTAPLAASGSFAAPESPTPDHPSPCDTPPTRAVPEPPEGALTSPQPLPQPPSRSLILPCMSPDNPSPPCPPSLPAPMDILPSPAPPVAIQTRPSPGISFIQQLPSPLTPSLPPSKAPIELAHIPLAPSRLSPPTPLPLPDIPDIPSTPSAIAAKSVAVIVCLDGPSKHEVMATPEVPFLTGSAVKEFYSAKQEAQSCKEKMVKMEKQQENEIGKLQMSIQEISYLKEDYERVAKGQIKDLIDKVSALESQNTKKSSEFNNMLELKSSENESLKMKLEEQERSLKELQRQLSYFQTKINPVSPDEVFNAAYSGDLQVIELWYLQSKNLEIRNTRRNNMTLLYTAARENRINIVSFLLKNGVKVDAIEDRKSTALHGAAYGGHLTACQLLVEHNAPVDAVNLYGEFPIDNAFASSSTYVIQFLANQHRIQAAPLEIYFHPQNKILEEALLSMERGEINPKVHETWSKRKIHNDINVITYNILQKGNLSLLKKVILKYNIDIHKKDHDNLTFLHYASANGNSEIMKWLIENNLNVNECQLSTLYTPLHLSALNGSYAACDVLIKSSANVSALSSKKETALLLAKGKKHIMIVELLKAHTPLDVSSTGINTSIIEEDYDSLMKICSLMGNNIKKIIDDNKILLKLSMKPTLPLDVQKWLLSNDPNLNVVDEDGNSALYLAIRGGNKPLVYELLKSNINVTLINKEGQTLHDFCQLYNPSLLGLLPSTDTLESLMSINTYVSINDTSYQITRKNLETKYGKKRADHILGTTESKFHKLQTKMIQMAVKVEPMIDAVTNGIIDIDIDNTPKHEILNNITFPSWNSSPSLTRTNLPVGGANCFKIEKILTDEECNFFVDLSEKLNYKSMAEKVPESYRSNMRLLVKSDKIAEVLWSKISKSFDQKDVFRIRPVGFGNKGTWRPTRLNECMKFVKYTPGGSFSKHMDGPWVPRLDESSIYTLVIYLNDDYKGGETKFFDQHCKSRDVTVRPQRGMGLIFNHDVFHAGEPVLEGTKYILRTEVMFRRVDSHLLTSQELMDYEKNENYLKTIKLYHKSQMYEREGKKEKFVHNYQKALEYQVGEQGTISWDCLLNNNYHYGTPLEVWVKIFSFLNVQDVVKCFVVSKTFFDILREGGLWRQLYQQRWPKSSSLESRLHPSVEDWYGTYWGRHVNEKRPRPIVVDLGGFSVKAGYCQPNSGFSPYEIRSIVAKLPDIYNFHGRRSQWTRYYCGEDAQKQFPNHSIRVIKYGNITDHSVLPELVTSIYYHYRTKPFEHSVILAEPIIPWASGEKDKLKRMFQQIFRVPSLHIIPTSSLVLFSKKRGTGIVIYLGEDLNCIAAVVNGRQVTYEILDFTANTQIDFNEIVYKTDQVIQRTQVNDITMLYSFITYAGGRTLEKDFYENLCSAFSKKLGYLVIKNKDPLYSSVKGGCDVGELDSFKSVVKESLEYSDEQRVQGYLSNQSDSFYAFYERVITEGSYWFFGFK